MVNRHMPQQFKDKCPCTRVVIDCTEIKCQMPSSLLLNTKLFSTYKNHNTLKSVVGITSGGAFSFISYNQVQTGSWHTCLKWCFFQTFNSFIISFFLNAVNPLTPPPESALSEVNERLEGPKYNIDFGGRGLRYTGEGDRYVHYSKRSHLMEVSQHFCPSL